MFSDFPLILVSCLALQPSGLAIHIFNDDIVDFAERRAVFQHLPRLIGMIVNFNHIFVADKGDYYEIADGLRQNAQ